MVLFFPEENFSAGISGRAGYGFLLKEFYYSANMKLYFLFYIFFF